MTMASSGSPSILGSIDLLMGRPTLRLQGARELAAASQTILLQSQASGRALTYGTDHGDDSIREHVAVWLSRKYRPASGPISLDRVILTNGAAGALAGVLQKFTDPAYTRRMFLVEPTYFLAIQTFFDAGLGRKMQGVPEDDEGIDLEFLRRRLEEEESRALDRTALDVDFTTKLPSHGYRKLYKYALYVVPTLSNPSGKTMSLHHRRALVELARQFDILLIADDVYDFLAWPDDDNLSHKDLELPPRLVDIDREMAGASEWGNTVSNGSFSKLMAPGLRVGWCEATPSFIRSISTYGPTASGGCPSQYTSFLIDHLLKSGTLERHVQDTLIPTYRRRYNVLVDAIKTHLYPLGIRISAGNPYETYTADKTGNRVPTTLAGGFFLYVDFPKDASFPLVTDIIRFGSDEFSLRIAPGEIFAVRGDPEGLLRASRTFNKGTRLCWAWHEEEDLVRGMAKLAEAIERARAVSI
ncbi:PLP-dependent transferase [Durotheca rogersii]|uniref:PLP-dependent transferase n=1 Tax=Durotheca rogersii TaxID=419775 RepID=UPI00221FE1A2|nr:PLP-dependent transferase [Durotheca rogersii]KAI5865217.1 PLP-dependent transferase [Durotheca rogersii]